MGREAAYEFARKYGIKLGKRLLVPARFVEAVLEGRWEELGLEAPARGKEGR